MERGFYPKASAFNPDRWLWPHFTPLELACRCGKFCGGEYFHDPDFLDALEAVSIRIGLPLRINSARRCALRKAALAWILPALAMAQTFCTWVAGDCRRRVSVRRNGITTREA